MNGKVNSLRKVNLTNWKEESWSSQFEDINRDINDYVFYEDELYVTQRDVDGNLTASYVYNQDTEKVIDTNKVVVYYKNQDLLVYQNEQMEIIVDLGTESQHLYQGAANIMVNENYIVIDNSMQSLLPLDPPVKPQLIVYDIVKNVKKETSIAYQSEDKYEPMGEIGIIDNSLL